MRLNLVYPVILSKKYLDYYGLCDPNNKLTFRLTKDILKLTLSLIYVFEGVEFHVQICKCKGFSQRFP